MIKLADIQDITLSAGEIIRKYFYEDVQVNYKSDETPVTIADLKTNEFLKEKLNKLMHQAHWLSEEDKDNKERLSQEYVWVVDPLDGTQSFVEKMPELSVSIALLKNGIPFIGAVYNPITRQGGFYNGFTEELKFIGFEPRKAVEKLESAKIVVSRSEFIHRKINEFFKEFPHIKPVGSVANKLMKIAGGSEDFYYSVHPKSEWDIAGGVALLQAAGKKYVRFDNQPLVFNQDNPIVDSGSVAGSDILLNQFFKEYSHLIKTIRREN